MRQHEHDPAAIHDRSLATVRREAALGRVPNDVAEVAARVYLCLRDGEVAGRVAFLADAVLGAGAPVLADREIVAAGITGRLLPDAARGACRVAPTKIDRPLPRSCAPRRPRPDRHPCRARDAGPRARPIARGGAGGCVLRLDGARRAGGRQWT